MERENLKNANRIVIKVGTSTLTYNTGKLNYRRFEDLARVISDLQNRGKEIILVSSGAISTGANKMNLAERPETVREKQAAAAVGQCEMMNVYARAFANYNHLVGQILLSPNIFENRTSKNNVINTFEALMEMGIIPIVNENDSVSTDEIKFGDNDALSAIVAVLTNADLLIILSDIDGLYNDNPKENPDAVLIDKVYEITEELERISGGSGSNRGTGGMQTKIHAADMAIKSGINTIVMNGTEPEAIYKVLEGSDIGTLFVMNEVAARTTARERSEQ